MINSIRSVAAVAFHSSVRRADNDNSTMKTIACINAVSVSPYAELALADGVSAVDRVKQYTEALPGLERVLVFVAQGAPAELPETWEAVAREAWTAQELLGELTRVGREYGDEDTLLLHYFIDAPFLDLGISRRMLENHRRYFAEYTFADGFPDAVAPTILNHDMPERLLTLVKPEDDPADWELLFTVLRRDINAFEVETELSNQDYRGLRLHLRCNCRRNYLLCRALYGAGARDEQSLLRLVQERAELLRTVPAYSSVQVVREVVQPVLYDPFRLVSDPRLGPVEVQHRSNEAGGTDELELAPEKFAEYLDMLASFSGDAVVEISHWGEAGRHSRLQELVSAAVARPSISLIVRTGGVGWPNGMLERVAESADESVRLVIELDANEPELYRTIRGEGFAEAQRFTERALELFGSRCHIQAVRTDLNEEPLEDYYRSWKTRTENVIIQKYDDCAGRLTPRKVVDLSPIKRYPCWHLKRDLVVLLDGSVPVCKQDLDLEHRLGNVFEDGIESVWAAADRFYRAHLSEDYPSICRSCDEYYTFNF